MSLSAEYALVKGFVKERIPALLKEPRGYLHYPFIDPGSVYDGNVWDWDTYWSVYGLLPLMEELEPWLQEKILVHARGNVLNLLDHQLEDGYVPMMVEYNGEEEPYLITKHKQGRIMNMCKPFLCRQAALISNYTGDYSWVDLGKLERYLACYDRYYLHEATGLYVWADDVMIGVDNDPAVFGRPPFSTASVYLNSFLSGEFRAMADILSAHGLDSRSYISKAEALSEKVREMMFDGRDGWFYSQDVDVKTRAFDWFHQGLGVFWKTLPVKIQSWTGFIPMYEGIATEEQAWRLVQRYHADKAFRCPYGITTLSQDESMFNIDATINPSNWLGPVWLVANYVVQKGFRRYGYIKEAAEIAAASLRLLAQDLRTSSELHEYYNPFTGAPVMNGGFINWNLLALNMAQENKEELYDC